MSETPTPDFEDPQSPELKQTQELVSEFDAGNILGRTFHEIALQHRGFGGRNQYGRRNDYGALFSFTVPGRDGDVTLGVGTKEPKTGIMLIPKPFAAPRGLYILGVNGKAERVATRPKQIGELLMRLSNDKGVDYRLVTRQVITNLQEQGYQFSARLTNDLASYGLLDNQSSGVTAVSGARVQPLEGDMHKLARESTFSSDAEHGEMDREFLLFGPLGRDAYSSDAQKRIEDAFGDADPAKAENRKEREKMWENYERLKTRVQELLVTGKMDILSAERQAIREISPLANEQMTEPETNLAEHLKEATAFAEQLVLNGGKSRFPDLLTERQAQILARIITPSHDLLKYMAAPKGEDFTADHQVLAENFIREVYTANPGVKVEGLGDGSILTQEDVDFIAGVVGDHENIFKEATKNGQIYSSDPVERAKAIFFLIDTFTGVLKRDDEGAFFIDDGGEKNGGMLYSKFINLYERQLAVDNGVSGKYGKIFRPQWGSYTVANLVDTLNVLEKHGLQLARHDERSTKEILVDAGINAIDRVIAANEQRINHNATVLAERDVERVFDDIQIGKIESARRQIEALKITWLTRENVYVRDIDGKEKKIEVVKTPDESDIVPFTSDGRIVLVRRPAPALGESTITILSAANNEDNSLNPDDVARRALNKLYIPDTEGIAITRTANFNPGKINPWKYLTSEAHGYTVDLPVASTSLSRESIVDERTLDVITLSKDEFYQAIDSGEISDLRTIVAVQFALAQREQEVMISEFNGDDTITSKLVAAPIIRTETTDEIPADDWFPRRGINGDDVIVDPSRGQAQMLGVVERSDRRCIVFVIEPFFAQGGKRGLSLPSGSIDENETPEEAAARELQEETGYISGMTEPLTPSRYPLPLYLSTRSIVCTGDIVAKGEREGGDEMGIEQGEGAEIPVEVLWWYVKNGYISDASTLAALFDWGRKQNPPVRIF